MTKRLSLLLAAGLAAVLPASAAAAESLLICQLTGKMTPAAVAKKYGVTLKDVTPNAPFALFSVPTEAMGDKVQAAMLLDTVNIVFAEDDEQVVTPESQARATASPTKIFAKGSSVGSVGDRRALQTINRNFLAQVGWNGTIANATGGRTVRVAILDNGLSPKQTALWSKVDASYNAVEVGKPAYDQPMLHDSNRNGKKDEALGHGTMIAGIIDQVAPASRFVIVRVSDSDGNATAWTIIKGLAFAVTSKAEVANISLGTLEGVPALSDAMDWVEQNRMLVVGAIGNNGVKDACLPAKISKIVCVTGLEPDNFKAAFSNWDSAADMAAPATGFASQFWDGTLAIWSGTSFAAPVVAGAVADCLRRLPTAASPGTLRKALENSGMNIDRINSKFKGKIGYLVNHGKLDQTLRRP